MNQDFYGNTFTPTPAEELKPFSDDVIRDWGEQDAAVRSAGGLVEADAPLPLQEYPYRLTRLQLEALLAEAFCDGLRSAGG